MTTIDRKQKVQELLDFHQKTFNALGVESPLFAASMAYKPYGKNELHISLFPSQLLKGKDIYTELVNKDYSPDTTTRTLYKWSYNKFWKEEYDSVEMEHTDDRRYLIPLSELVVVEPPLNKVIEFDSFDEIMDPDEDCPLDQMTVRDLAAIILQRPVSRRKWLNQIVKSK